MKYTLNEHQNKQLISKELSEYAGVIPKVSQEKLQMLNESAKGKSKRKLIVKMEAIHVGRTKNFTFYTDEGLKSGLKSWTQPYNKPVLTHHDDSNGEPIGRILEANYSEQTMAGKPGLVFTVEITDSTAIEKVLDGRYQTVSIGASTDKVTCNICGTDRTESWCEHYPGDKYEDQVAHMIVGTTYGREVSYVNTPADENAGNRSIQVVDTDDEGNSAEHTHMDMYQMAEGLYQNIDRPDVNLFEHLSKDMQGLLNSMVAVKERSEEPVDHPASNEESTIPTNEGTSAESSSPETTTTENLETPTELPVNENATPVEQKETPLDESQVISGLKIKLSEMQSAMSNLVLEKSKIESKLAEAQEENVTLQEQNANLLADSHKTLAEKVVDLKLSLNKSDVIGVDRTESVNNHLKRTTESLEDSLQDLLAESKSVRPVPGSVTNPGVAEEENRSGTREMTAEEGLNLFKNMLSPKKKR